MEHCSLQMRNVTPQPYQPPRPFTAAAAAAPAMTVKRTSTDDLLQEYGLDFSKLTTTATATRPATLSTHHQPSLLLPTALPAAPAGGGHANLGNFVNYAFFHLKNSEIGKETRLDNP